jgi:PII-like signaling protein
MAGATVFEAVEGYGSSGSTQRHHLVGGSAPLTFVIVDDTERVDRFLAELGQILDHVLVTVHDVDVVDR